MVEFQVLLLAKCLVTKQQKKHYSNNKLAIVDAAKRVFHRELKLYGSDSGYALAIAEL